MTMTKEQRNFVSRVREAARSIGKVTQRKAAILSNRLWAMRIRSAQLAEAACNRLLTAREERRDEDNPS
jgi:hypothetical protein